ncbi:uncharacterized protein LOC119069472 [Bradysia coprophila]|uniref:uncharacterized protein LOC119069472 n=1 Tax=Bradysia coprophila TaxID=38358 RepID=UPI00187D9185|nr:uncharacterized protein LOC119069472 [Bradysia coprophila]
MNVSSRRAGLIGETWTATNFTQLNEAGNFFQLSFDDQRILLEYDIDFQGFQIPLKYVLAADAKSLQFLRINDVLSHTMRLGADVKFDASQCSKDKNFLQNRTNGIYRNYNRNRYDEVDMDTVIADARINKRIYLSDIPTVDIPDFARVVAQQLKKKLPWYWIVSLNLQSVSNVAEKFEDREAVSAYISKNVLNLTDFEEKAFHDIFTSNRVIFLVTLSADLNRENASREIRLLNAIKRESDNQLWIFGSVRNFDLISRLSMTVYRQLPIEDNFWVRSADKLFYAWDKFDRRQAKDRNEWRLELSVWANISIENSLHCDDHDDVWDRSLYGIFKHYTDIIISSIESPTLTRTDVESIYQHRAMQTLFPNYYQGHLAESWFPNLPMVDFSTLNFDRSFIYRNRIHAVTAEFFVVEFFRQRLFASGKNVTDSIPNTLKAILSDWDQYDKVHVFMEGLYTFLLSGTQTEALNGAVKHFEQFYTTAKLQQILIHAIYLGDVNTVKIIAKTFENNPKELCELLDYKAGPVGEAAEFQSVDFVERLLKLLRDQLDADCFKNLFFKRGIYDRNPIFLSAERMDNFDFLLNHPIVPLTSNEKAYLLMEFDEKGKNVLVNLMDFRKSKCFSNAFKAMGQFLDKEHAKELLYIDPFLKQLHSIDFDLVSPEIFDVLLHWSKVYSLRNETRKIFVMENSQYLRSRLLRDANSFVVEAFWSFFETVYRSSSERKVFLNQNEDILQDAMHNNDRKVFSFVKEKFDLLLGPQKSKTLIWDLMLESVYRFHHRQLEEIDFYWPFFEEIYRNQEERRVKLKEKDSSHRTLLYLAWYESINKYWFVVEKYNELLNQDEMHRAERNESDSPWYMKLWNHLWFSS